MNFYKATLFRIFLLPLSLAMCACGAERSSSADASDSDDRYKIVSTVGMITDVVRHVAGEHAEVAGLIGEGVDPHLYQPTRGDVVKLQQADVIFYNGLLLEGKMADVLSRMANSGKPVHAVTERILQDDAYIMMQDDGSGYADPHVWMDVAAWRTGVEVIAEALAAYDPANAADYRSRAAAYSSKLKALHQYALDAMATIPADQRVLVTAHDAFQYMGRVYGLEVRGIQGISTESEAGLRDVETLIHFIVERRIPAVFVETSVSDKNIRALIEGARARGHAVRIGGALFSDAMGKPGTYQGTYIGMIDHNVTTIVNALGGQAGGFASESH